MSDIKIRQYQAKVKKSDQFKDDTNRSVEISFRNIRKELDHLQQDRADGTGSLKSNKNRLGDIAWYLTNLANHLSIDLADLITANSEKIEKLYLDKSRKRVDPDVILEKLPRKFDMIFFQRGRGEVSLGLKLDNGEFFQIGDTINDNSHKEDFYRYHDVFHLTLLAHLNWSPVLRSLLKRKRKSDKKIDVVEDGARAAILEEAISAAVFEKAKKSTNFFDGMKKLDFELLDLIKTLTKGLEVYNVHHTEWEEAILKGYDCFRKLIKNEGGIIRVSDRFPKLVYMPISSNEEANRVQKFFRSKIKKVVKNVAKKKKRSKKQQTKKKKIRRKSA